MEKDNFSLTEKDSEGNRRAGVFSRALTNKRKNMVMDYIKGDVLDVGCCYRAEFYIYRKPFITKYYGIEYEHDVVENLKKTYPECTFYQKDLDEDTWDLDTTFDCILMVGLVEHIYNQKHLMSEAKKYLKPNGIIVITTPTPLGNDIVHVYGSKLGLFSQIAANDHVVIYNKKRFQIIAKDVGLTLDKYQTFELGCNQLAILKNNVQK